MQKLIIEETVRVNGEVNDFRIINVFRKGCPYSENRKTYIGHVEEVLTGSWEGGETTFFFYSGFNMTAFQRNEYIIELESILGVEIL